MECMLEIVVSLANFRGDLVLWIVKPWQPDLVHADRSKFVLTVNETADVIIMLMSANDDIQWSAICLFRNVGHDFSEPSLG
jgi:hypothetical protein